MSDSSSSIGSGRQMLTVRPRELLIEAPAPAAPALHQTRATMVCVALRSKLDRRSEKRQRGGSCRLTKSCKTSNHWVKCCC
jgi:hypothetical protein